MKENPGIGSNFACMMSRIMYNKVPGKEKLHLALKASKAKAEKEGKLAGAAEEIARKFGRLLSYTDETIDKMLAKQLKD